MTLTLLISFVEKYFPKSHIYFYSLHGEQIKNLVHPSILIM